MRTVKVDKEVLDVSGYFFDLVKAGFEVLSISVYDRRTLVNLEDEEDKDPAPLAEPFFEAPSKRPSKSIMEERRGIYEKYLKEKPFRMENLRARYRVSQEVREIAREASAGGPFRNDAPVALLDEQRPEVLALAPDSKEGWLQKLRNFF